MSGVLAEFLRLSRRRPARRYALADLAVAYARQVVLPVREGVPELEGAVREGHGELAGLRDLGRPGEPRGFALEGERDLPLAKGVGTDPADRDWARVKKDRSRRRVATAARD